MQSSRRPERRQQLGRHLRQAGQVRRGVVEGNTSEAFQRVLYGNLNSRQKEAFNFQKISAVLADYGFLTIRLSNDWGGADFIAQHSDGVTFLKVQLKGRLTFDQKYKGRDLHVCFPDDGQWFLYPHDKLLRKVLAVTKVARSKSWRERGGYSFPGLSKQLRPLLEPYRLHAHDGDGMAGA